MSCPASGRADRMRRGVRRRLIGLAFGVLAANLVLVPMAPQTYAQIMPEPGARNRDCPTYPEDHDDPRITWTELSARGATAYNGVFFLDADRGWAVGRPGVIVFTRDGGLTWGKGVTPPGLDLSTTDLTEVVFVDEDNGWVIAGSTGSTLDHFTGSQPLLVLRTTNGGLTWDRQPMPDVAATPGFESEQFPVLIRLSVVKKPDGRVQAWITGVSSEGADNKRDRGLLFTDTQELGSSASNWKLGDVMKPDGSRGPVLGDTQFFDAARGLATAGGYGGRPSNREEGAVFATRDGGASWSLEFANPESEANLKDPQEKVGEFQLLAFADEFHGHALWHKDEHQGKYYSATPDGQGGRRWQRTGGDPKGTCQKWPGASAFVTGPNCDNTTGPGCNGIIGRNFDSSMSMTTDGGSSWVPDMGVDNKTYLQKTNDLSYPAPTVAYAVGQYLDVGRIFKASISLVEVDSIEPPQACVGAVVTIRGSGFTNKSTVSFGPNQVPQSDVTYVSGRELKAKVPPRSGLDTVDVTVTTPESAPGKGDQLGTSIPNEGSRFTYLGAVVDPLTGKVEPPTVTSLDLKEGKVAGGDRVAISGTNLACAQRVVFGTPGGPSAPASDIEIIVPKPSEPTNAQVLVKSPRWDHRPMTVDVVVMTPGPIGAVDIPSVPEEPPDDDFTYLALPAISAVNPPRGPAFGGTTVTITGTGLEGATEVRFGDAPPAPVARSAPTSITTTTPPNAVGPVPVTVSTPKRGASLASSAAQFTYHPGISGIFPPTGPTTGGTEVTIVGKGLAGTSIVRFGNDAVNFTERSDTELLAVAPPHTIPEAVAVSLVASGLSSLPEDVLFTYGLAAGGGDGGGGGGVGLLNENLPPPEAAPPGGSPAASPSLSSAPSPVASGSPAPGSSPVPGGAGAAGASAAPGASPGHAPSSVNAPMGAALPVPLASPVAAPGAAGQGAPGSGQGAVGSEDNDEAQGAQRYAMSDASAGLALGGAAAAGCFSWLAVARRSSRRRQASPAGRPSPKGAY